MIRMLSFLMALFIAGVAAGPASAADKLTVLLEWFVNPDHAPMVIARERGLFAEAGLEVELVPPADPSAVPRLVSARQADVGVDLVVGGLPAAVERDRKSGLLHRILQTPRLRRHVGMPGDVHEEERRDALAPGRRA